MATLRERVTLLEIIVIVVVLGLLAAILLPPALRHLHARSARTAASTLSARVR